MQTLWQDLRYGVRMLVNKPGFALVAIITLALGIGANTAIFSVVNTVLLRPLPYPEPERLAQIWETYVPQFPTIGVSGGNFQEWKMQAQSFAEVAAYRYVSKGMNLTGEDEPEQLAVTYASANLFSMLGVNATAGRTFLSAEDEPGTSQVALISHNLWQRRFKGDARAIGKLITLDGQGFEVVGILPAGFNLPQWADVWLPIGQMNAELTSRVYHPFSIIARLKPGVTFAEAQAELTTRAQQLELVYPKTSKNFGVTVLSLQDAFTGQQRPALLLLLGAVALVLLIACANVANLLLVRGAMRHKEMALRTALGATRWRIVRQLLTESLLLALLGGALGLLVAFWGVDLLKALIPAELPQAKALGLDGRLLGFTMALSLLTGVVCGLLPALQASTLNLNEVLKDSSQSIGAGLRRHRLRRLLVVAEVAIALVLLVGGGLLVKSFIRLLRVDPGYEPDHLLTMQVSLPNDAVDGGGLKGAALFQRIAERIQALPGVEAVGGVRYLPLTTEGTQRSRFIVEGQPNVDVAALPVAEIRDVSVGYFQAMGIPLRAGRFFTERDWGQPQMMISETMARQYWADGDPIGKRVNVSPVAPQPTWVTVVGVVGDVHQLRLDGQATADIYLTGNWTRRLVIRATGDPLSLVAGVREEIHAVDKNLPISEIRTMNQVLAESVATRRFSMLLLALFAMLALLLAVVGVYGVMSYTVTGRTREIGIRMALGAQSGDVFGLVIGHGTKMIGSGVAIGLLAALALTRLMASLLYGVSATDPVIFIVVALLLTGVALLACYIPARRATKVDPMIALRYE